MIQPLQPYIYNMYAQNYSMPAIQPVQPQTLAPSTIQMPQGERNYILVDPMKVDYFVNHRTPLHNRPPYRKRHGRR